MEKVAVLKASPDPLAEVAAYLSPMAPLFRRSESRGSVERYVTGLLTDLPRKNCDTIAAAVAGTSTERLQHLLTDADWDPLALDEARVRGLVGVSPAGGVLVLDDTGIAKQGKHSVGVSRQYSGTLGKIGNCQVVVSAEYMAGAAAQSAPLHWPVGAQVYLPAAWASDADRRRRARVPDEVDFQTKWEIALALVDRAVSWGVPFGAVVVDAGYGDNPKFLDGLEDRALPYVCAVEGTFGIRLAIEVQATAAAVVDAPARRGRGRPKLPRPAPLYTTGAVATALPETAWRTIAWRDGTKGTLCKQFAAVRVHRATGSPDWGTYGRSARHGRITTGPQGWLLAERSAPGDDGDRKWYYANLPADTPLEQLVELAHSRWVVEQFYEDAKCECGFADHQGRRWDSLHRHLALVMLTYSFLVLQRLATPTPPTGGLSPLSHWTDLPRRPPLRPRLAPAGPRPLVRAHRPDRALPSATELTK
jgi:SRSO17 transposase